MYTCPLHNWFSNESPCPACQISVTSSLTSSEPVEQRTFTLKDMIDSWNDGGVTGKSGTPLLDMDNKRNQYFKEKYSIDINSLQ